MKYTEFKKSAKRHLDTCSHLTKTLNSVQTHASTTTHTRQEYQNNLLLNVYYLSGYVIECILKYTFFQSIHYDQRKDVEELDQHDCDRTFNDLKTHRFDELIALVEKYDKHLPSDIPILRQRSTKEVERMFKSWDPAQRYISSGIDKTVLEEYLSVVGQIHSKLSNR
jgi:hypothetical protein